LVSSNLQNIDSISDDGEGWDEGWDVDRLPPRRRARAAALQVLFEVDASGHGYDGTLRWAMEENNLTKSGKTLTRDLVSGVIENRTELDALIQHYAPIWPVEQLSFADRNLLRLALYEIRIDARTSSKIVISEIVELAKLFGGENSPQFINGVLGAAMDEVNN